MQWPKQWDYFFDGGYYEEDGCFISTDGYIDPETGYRAMYLTGRRYRLNRLSYAMSRGKKYRQVRGFVVTTCSNKQCIKPDHLEVMKIVGLPRKIDRETAIEIKKAEGHPRDIAKKYGVSRPYVYNIKAGRVWKELKNV